jgi:hypothetical protein
MRRAERRLLAACDRILDQVPLPIPFEINGYIRALEQARGRPIRLTRLDYLPTADPSHPYGWWWATDLEDRFFLRSDLSPLHLTIVFLHEAGHMQLGHDRDAPPIEEQVDILFPSSGVGVPMYTREQEREAEMFAARVLDRAAIPPAWRPESGRRDLVGRLSESLGHPVRQVSHHG